MMCTFFSCLSFTINALIFFILICSILRYEKCLKYHNLSLNNQWYLVYNVSGVMFYSFVSLFQPWKDDQSEAEYVFVTSISFCLLFTQTKQETGKQNRILHFFIMNQSWRQYYKSQSTVKFIGKMSLFKFFRLFSDEYFKCMCYEHNVWLLTINEKTSTFYRIRPGQYFTFPFWFSI